MRSFKQHINKEEKSLESSFRDSAVSMVIEERGHGKVRESTFRAVAKLWTEKNAVLKWLRAVGA